MKAMYYLHIIASVWCSLCAYVWCTTLLLQDAAIRQGTFNVMISTFMLLRAMQIGEEIESLKRHRA